MRTKINEKWLLKNTCCENKKELKLTNKIRDIRTICNWLFDHDRTEDACFIISKCMDLKTAKKYALYGVKKTVHVHENLFPNNIEVRDRIKAIEKYNRNPTEKNRQKLKNNSFTAADYAASAFHNATDDNYFNYASIDAATSITIAIYDIFNDRKMQKQIMNYGLRLLYEKEKGQ